MSKIKSIAIIIDGNRRWAVKNGLKKTEGHEYGLKKINKTISWIKEEGVENMTFYVFSTENWNRSKNEVNILMILFEKVFTEKIEEFINMEVSVKFVGSINKFSKKLQKIIKDTEEKTKHFKTKVFFAASYGGRAEIVDAVKNAGKDLTKKELEKMTEKKFESFLWTADIPDPEIIIRTGGNRRLSNFLLWKGAYSEIYFLNTLWPDFSKKLLGKILEHYYKKVKINKGK